MVGPEGASWSLVLLFAAAVMVLEYFDISLPRGDSLGVSGSLHSASIVILGPLTSLAAAVVGTATAIGARQKTERNTDVGIEVVSLSGAFSIAVIADFALRSSTYWSGAPAARTVLVSAVYLVSELIAVQLLVARRSDRSAQWLIRGNAVRQAPLLLAEWSSAVLAVITFPSLGGWSLVLVVVLLLLIRQSYALLLEVRETYRTTVQVIAEAAERVDARLEGHAERTAAIAREIGCRCGLSPADLERVSYAALLHDIWAISEYTGRPGAPSSSSLVFGGAATFEDVARILRILETPDGGELTAEVDVLAAVVVALADAIDAANNPSVAEAHHGSILTRIAQVVPGHVVGKAAAVAVRLGFDVPDAE